MSTTINPSNYSIQQSADKLEQAKLKEQAEAKAKAEAEASVFNQSFQGKVQNFTGINTDTFGTNFNMFESGKSWGTEFSELFSGLGQVAGSPFKILGNILSSLGGITSQFRGNSNNAQAPQTTQQFATINPNQLGGSPIFILGSGQLNGQQVLFGIQQPTTQTGTTQTGTTQTGTTPAATKASAPATSSNQTLGQVGTDIKGNSKLATYGLETTNSGVRAAVEEYNEASNDVEKFTNELNAAATKEGATGKAENQDYVNQQTAQAKVDYFTEKIAATQKDLASQEAILNGIDDSPENKDYKAQIQASVDRLKAQIEDLTTKKNAAEIEAAQAEKALGDAKPTDEDKAKAAFQAAQAKLEAAQELQAKTQADVNDAVKGALGNKEGTDGVDAYVQKLGGKDGIAKAQARVQTETATADKVEEAAGKETKINDATIKAMAKGAVSQDTQNPECPKALKGQEKAWEQAVKLAKIAAGIEDTQAEVEAKTTKPETPATQSSSSIAHTQEVSTEAREEYDNNKWDFWKNAGNNEAAESETPAEPTDPTLAANMEQQIKGQSPVATAPEAKEETPATQSQSIADKQGVSTETRANYDYAKWNKDYLKEGNSAAGTASDPIDIEDGEPVVEDATTGTDTARVATDKFIEEMFA